MRAKSTPTDPVTIVDTETERLLRDRLAELRPGDPIARRGGGRLGRAVEPGRPTVGARPDRRHGELRLRHRGVRGVGGRAGRRRVGGGCRRERPDGRGVLGGAWVTAPASGATACRRRCAAHAVDGAVDGAGGHRVRLRAASSASRQAAVLARLLPDVRDVRRIGSCALDLCMVAAGRLDAYYEDGVHVWDWAAGALIAAEAGATVRLPPVDGGGIRADRRRGAGHRRGVRRRAAARGRDAMRDARSAGAGVDLRQQRRVRGLRWRRAAGSRARRRCRRCG